MTTKNDPELDMDQDEPKGEAPPKKSITAKMKSKAAGRKGENPSKQTETGQAPTMFYLHSVLLFSGRILHRVLNFYNSFFDLKPSDKATIYRNISNQYTNRGLHEKALQYLQEWSRLEPSNPDAHYHLGVALTTGENLRVAVHSFDRVLALNPGHKGAMYRRAGLSLKLKEYEKAIEDLENLCKVIPENPKPLYLLGIAYDRIDQVDKAVEAMKKAIELNAEEIKYYQHLGFLYERKEDHKQAAKCFSRVMELQREQDEE